MKTKTGIGWSEITPIKQEHFRTIIKAHIAIVEAVNKRNGFNNHYYYIDMNSGNGGYQGIKGSPIIFLEEMRKSNLTFTAFFIEKNKHNVHDLYVNAAKFCDLYDKSSFYIIQKDSENAIKDILDRPEFKSKNLKYGIIYHDPNGVFYTDLLIETTQNPAISKMDLLINCNATSIKRVAKSPVHKESRNLQERLEEINKREWLIREGHGKQQWSFLFGTNWDKCPEFKQIGMFNIKSRTGKEILKNLNYTNNELKTFQEPDFFNPMQLAFNF